MASEWFPHDYHARSDASAMQLLCKCNASGYGVFWCCIELLHVNSRLPLETLPKVVASLLMCDLETAQTAIATMLEVGLLKQDGVLVYSERVDRNQQERQGLTDKRSKAAAKRWGVVDANAMQVHSKSNANAMQEQCYNITEQNITVQDKKREEGRGRIRLPEQLSDVVAHFLIAKSTAEEAERFWNHYESQGWKKANGLAITNWRPVADQWIKNPTTQKGTNGTRKSGVGDRVATTDVRSYNDRISQAIGIDPKGEPSALVPSNAQPLARSTQDRIGTRTDSGDARDAPSGELHSRASGTG